MPVKPLLIYFPAAGRGELCRLIAAAGQVDLDDYFPGSNYKSKVGLVGTLPVILHGNLNISQSSACEKYLASLAPRFTGLTPEQTAVDNMFAAAKEDMLKVTGGVVFGDKMSKARAIEVLPDKMDKFLSALEGMLPDKGFVNGLDFPTVADLALLNVAEARHPFGAAMAAAGYDWQSKYPKILANVARTRAAPGVKEYLSVSKSMTCRVGPFLAGKVVGKAIGHALTFNTFRRHGTGCVSRVYQRFEEPLPAPERSLTPASSSKPELIYFPIAGRGELIRLIAAAGGLEIMDRTPEQAWKSGIGLFGNLPVLNHGNLHIAQSGAIESYISTIAPKFKSLTVQQRALDDCFVGIKGDLLAICGKFAFGGDEIKAKAPTDLPPLLDKFLAALESLTPKSGFVQGLDFPTTADLVLLNFAEATIPFGRALEAAGGFDWQGKYPNISNNVIRTKDAPGIKEYLAETKSMK